MATLTTSISAVQTEGFASFKRLIVAYDFSSYANTALDYALDLASKQHSEIILVHVQPGSHAVIGRENFENALNGMPNPHEELERVAGHSLQRGINTRFILKSGATADGLAQAVADLQADVLFLGAYGNNRLDRKVLGSTAQSLLRTLPCPIVTIGPKAVKRSSNLGRPEKVICPIDFPDDIHERLRMIARLAKALTADVELVHAVDVRHEYSRPHSAADTQFEFDLLVGRLLNEGIAATSTLLYGSPDHVLSKHAHAVNANYILFGLHRDGHTSSYSRKSLVGKVIKNAPCAIFTFAQPVQTL